MFKDFDLWNTKKKDLHYKNQSPFFFEGEIWWCSIGLNVGTEQDGKNALFERPVLIIAKINYDTAWALPLSGKSTINKYRLRLNSTNSQIVLSQIRTVSGRRFIRKMSVISNEEFNIVIENIVGILRSKIRNPATWRGISGTS